jgi:hypothetical protein
MLISWNGRVGLSTLSVLSIALRKEFILKIIEFTTTRLLEKVIALGDTARDFLQAGSLL